MANSSSPSNSSSLSRARWATLAALVLAPGGAAISVTADPWVGAALSALGGLAALLCLLSLARAERMLGEVSAICHRVGAGDMEARVVPISEGGSLGDLCHAVNHMVDVTDAFVRESEASLKHVAEGKFFRRILLRGLLGEFHRSAGSINEAVVYMQGRDGRIRTMADEFENGVKDVVDILASAATEMEATASGMTTNAASVGERSESVRLTAQTATGNVETVAAAAEELAASVEEITRSVGQSNDVTLRAVSVAQNANAEVDGLKKAADHIGDVISLIADIAEQTNLLALNATIEAARAGEAGKGFAVVANEVKSLANQTARATDDITAQVADMQAATDTAVGAIQRISTVIDEVRDIAATIAASVEEQGAATREIARNVQEAASGTREVSETVGDVSESARETGRSAQDVLEAAGELAKQAETLRDDVDRFLTTMRAA